MKKNRFQWVLITLLAVTLACGQTSNPVVQQPTLSTPQSPTSTSTPAPPGPCENILYPLVPGYQWIYQLDTQDGAEPSKLGLTVEKVENSRALINALDISTGVVTQTIALCDNGAIQNFPALTQRMLIGNAAVSNFDLQYVSGVFAPAEAAFTDNDWLYQWQADYIATGEIQVQEEGEQMTIVLQDSPVHLKWQTAGAGDAAFESITVPAGTFERALKVQREAQLDITLEVEGMAVSGTLILHVTQWYEPFTGLLKSQIDSGDVTYLGITFPIDVKGTVELVEFTPGD